MAENFWNHPIYGESHPHKHWAVVCIANNGLKTDMAYSPFQTVILKMLEAFQDNDPELVFQVESRIGEQPG